MIWKLIWIVILETVCGGRNSYHHGHRRKSDVHIEPKADKSIIVSKDVFCDRPSDVLPADATPKFFSWSFVAEHDKEFLISGHQKYFTILEVPFLSKQPKKYFDFEVTPQTNAAKNNCERANFPTEHCTKYITAIAQKKLPKSDVVTFQVCNTNYAQPQLETWDIDYRTYEDTLNEKVKRITKDRGAVFCPTSFKTSTLMKWVDEEMRVSAIGLDNDYGGETRPLITVFVTTTENTISTNGNEWFNDTNFRLIASDDDHVHFFFSDIEEEPNEDPIRREEVFQQKSIPKIGSLCKSGFELSHIFYLGYLSCKDGDYPFPIFVDAVETSTSVIGIFQSRATTYQKNAICRFPKSSLTVDCASDDREEFQLFDRRIVEGELIMSPRESVEYGAFTSLTVDTKNEKFPLVFIGTDNGILLKTARFEDKTTEFLLPTAHRRWRLVEAYNVSEMAREVANPGKAENPRFIHKVNFRYNDNRPYVYVATDACLMAVSVQNCPLSSCCQNEPYCELSSGTCVALDLKIRLPLNKTVYSSSCTFPKSPPKSPSTPPVIFETIGVNDENCTEAQTSLKVDRRIKKELKRVQNVLDRVTKNWTHSEIMKKAMFSAAEIVLHRVYQENLDKSIPVPIQSSQMSVFPELAFHLQVLRRNLSEQIIPAKANLDCSTLQLHHRSLASDDIKQYCGVITYQTHWSRQLWNWMRQLLSAYSADCTTKENPILTGRSKILCKESICRFGFLGDIQTVFRETGSRAGDRQIEENLTDYELTSKYIITGLVVENKTDPFEFKYNPDKQLVTVSLHFNVDLHLLTENREKFRDIKKFRDIPEKVKAGFGHLADEIHNEIETSLGIRSSRDTIRFPSCNQPKHEAISFISDATNGFDAKEFEIFLALFDRFGSSYSSNIVVKKRTSLRRIFGGKKSPASNLTWTSTQQKCRYTVDINESSQKYFRLEFIGSTDQIRVVFYAKLKSRREMTSRDDLK